MNSEIEYQKEKIIFYGIHFENEDVRYSHLFFCVSLFNY